MNVLCFNPFNLKNKIMKKEHTKIFRSPSKILKNISWPINICLKYFMAPQKILRPTSCILNVRSLMIRVNEVAVFKVLRSLLNLFQIDSPKNEMLLLPKLLFLKSISKVPRPDYKFYQASTL